MSEIENGISTTELGNPRKPQGKAGAEMLDRMNDSHAEVTKWAFDFFEIDPNDNVLDIGCGGGAALARLSKMIPNGCLTGIDYSKVSVEESTKFNRACIDSGRMKILEGSVDSLPFDNNEFSKIVTVESFYFWPTPIESLKEVHRVLKKNGVFLLVADIYGKDDLDEHALENIKKFDLRNPTPSEFKDMFAKAGFSNTIIHLKNGTDWICVEGHY